MENDSIVFNTTDDDWTAEFINDLMLNSSLGDDGFDLIAELQTHSRNATANPSGVLILWLAISYYLWWTILVLGTMALPVLMYALFQMLTRYRRSNYFVFLTPMLIMAMVNLCTVIFNLCSGALHIHASILCGVTAFFINVTMCSVNWLWVAMFTHRFAHIFYAVHRAKKSRLTFLEDPRRMLIATFFSSVLTQIWTPIVMMDVTLTMGDTETAGVCSADESIIGPTLFRWIVVAESLWTYMVPFGITVFSDVAVLMFTRESKWFTTVTTKEVAGVRRDVASTQSFKIQSEESIRNAHKRRRRAVRRCLTLATTQLLLNMPNHVLQLVDEFVGLRSGDGVEAVIYLYADAVLYILYMLQFPLLAVFVRLLHSNVDARYNRRPKALRLISNGELFSTEATRMITLSPT